MCFFQNYSIFQFFSPNSHNQAVIKGFPQQHLHQSR
jgi:hypothetical protein